MELYPHNIARQNELQKKDIAYLLHRDILFYQRDLKSKKSSIGNCPLEIRYFEKDGETQTQAVKCIPKSHPLYQELRLWQWISNLRIYSNKDIQNEKPLFLETMQDRADLYDYLSAKKSIKQNDLLQHLLEHKQNLSPKEAKKQAKNYHWNYPTGDKNDKEYPCAETVSLIHRRLEKVYNCPDDFLTQEKLIALWHLIYSVRKGNEYEKALKTFARKNGLHIDSFTEAFKNFPAFSGTYGAYSEKAVKKLLALMRCGKYWNANDIDEHTRTRIQKLIDDGEMDENISLQTRNATEGFSQIEDFQGMPEYAAKYVVYNRHAETSYNEKWHSPADIERFLHEFRQHSLRNPIVEQVVLETLRTVKELWQQYGKDENDFFAAIHVELARELKKNKSERNEISNNQSKNEATNQRIRALLAVLGNDTSIENVIPYSPNQQDILKLYEEGALMATENIPADIAKIATTAAPTHKELLRYKLWLDQKYRSPYTNKIIPLSRLFTRDYEIEHIIPQSRYFDDSFNNKVICETEVNRLKGKQLALEFIRNPEKRKIIINGKEVIILDEEKYTQNVNKNFAGNKGKLKRLLMDEIPAKMIERQMNDTRYISKFVAQQLAKIVPLHENDDPMHERKNNVIITSGSITARLRNDWGLNNIWNKLMLPRFERMNELSNTTDFTYFNENHQKLIPTVPDQYRHKFQKKRIDHRHHALDALVVACTSRNMVNYLNNQSGLDEAMKQNKKLGKEDRQKARHDLRDKLCYKKDHDWFFNTPWVGFAKEAEAQLKNVVVSFKQNTRVLTMATNLYQKYVRQADGSWKKESVKQTKGDRLAIRKPLHQETVFGEVLLQKIQSLPLADALQNINNIADKQLRREIRHRLAQNHSLEDIVAQFKKEKYLWKGKKINKIDIYTYDTDAQGKPNMVAVRKALDDTFDANKIANITDTGIQKILLRHLENYHNDPKEAFSPEGIEAMNQQLPTLNNGKDHKPIYKVRLAEVKGAKFAIGQTGNKKDKYVVAAKGTNLYFAIYQTEAGERKYSSPPLNEVIERLKQKLPPVPTQDENGNPLLFYLSPNELVYVPTPEEQQTPHLVDFARLRPEQVQRIYKMVSCTNTQCMFIKQEVATSIVDKMEFSSLNKMEKDIEGNMIKHCCWKLHVTRLGIITKVEQ